MCDCLKSYIYIYSFKWGRWQYPQWITTFCLCLCRATRKSHSGLKTCWSSIQHEYGTSRSWQAWIFSDPPTLPTPAPWASKPTCTPLRVTTRCTERQTTHIHGVALCRSSAFSLHARWTASTSLFHSWGTAQEVLWKGNKFKKKIEKIKRKVLQVVVWKIITGIFDNIHKIW